MGIGEADALCCELVEVWGGDFGVWVVGVEVAVSEVVGKDEDDVGWARVCGGQSDEEGGEGENEFHGG